MRADFTYIGYMDYETWVIKEASDYSITEHWPLYFVVPSFGGPVKMSGEGDTSSILIEWMWRPLE